MMPESKKMIEDFESFRPGAGEKAPTVLQVLPNLISGGVERGTIDMAASLVSAGWRAIVASNGGPMVHELERVGATHFSLPIHSKNPLHWRQNFDALVNLITQEQVDIVHARSRIPAWISWRAARRTKAHFVTTFHQRPEAANALKRLYNSVMVRGDRVIAISHYIADRLINLYKLDPERLRIIPRGVDLEIFDPDKVTAERLIRLTNKWRLPDGVPIIMLPGRVSPWKGHNLLIDALAKLPKGSFHCLMVGDDSREAVKAKIEERVAANGLTPYVHFVGRTDDIAAAYKLADVVVSASIDPEPFGRVMIEAQAMGRPIVACGHGGASESVLDGETGWLVKPNDPAALAEGLERALALEEPQRQILSHLAVRNVRENFSKFQMCARTLSVYDELLSTSEEQG